MATFMTYEETVPYIQSSIYRDFHFFSEEHVLQTVNSLPDDPYGQLPEGVNPDQAKLNKAAKQEESGLSSKEKNAQNRFAEALCMRDNRKASAIGHYTKTVCFRDIEKCSTQGRSCTYSSVLKQVHNHDYVFDPESGEEYSELDFRRQIVLHCAQNAEEVYKLMKVNLDYSFKQFLKMQLDPNEDGDLCSLLGMRHMLNVSKPLYYLNCSGLLSNCPGFGIYASANDQDSFKNV